MEGIANGEELGEEESGWREEELVWSWGAGTDGQLGTGTLQDELLPRLLSLPLSAITTLACGGAHVVALTSGGKVFTWGRGSSGQLGQGEILSNCLQPKPVTFLESHFISNVSAGWSHSGFVSDTGCLFTCGDGSFGQLGHGDYKSHCSPVEVSFFASKYVHQIACGMRHSLVLLKGASQHHIYGFGSCKRGQVGIVDGKMKSINLPQVINGFENIEIADIIANGDHSAALSADGSMYNWGRGFTSSSDCNSPQHLDSSIWIKQAALGWNHALLLTDDGEVFTLGGHHSGGRSNPQNKSPASNVPDVEVVPEKVPGLDGNKVVQIAAGAEHSALITENGAIKTWGWGEHGQLGLGSTSDQVLPQDVDLVPGTSRLCSRHRIYCGSGFTLAIKIYNSSS